MKTIYYAHSLHLYGREQERRDIETLRSLGFDVINPSSEGIKNDFKKHNEENPDREDYMDFFGDIVRNCDFLAFRAHPDGNIPAGIGYEVKVARENNKVIIELPTLLSTKFLSLDDTREYLKLLGNR